MKAVVFTLGCKVNSCESDSLITGLKERGYEVYDTLTYADLYIVNTCAVTSEAEKKSRQMVARINKHNKNAKIIFTGCATEKNPQAFFGKENVTLVTGSQAKSKILQLLDEKGVIIEHDNGCFDEMPLPVTLRTRSYVKVQDGCNNFCSYCIIPYLRGRIRSRSPQSVIEEINAISGYEIIITGINLSAYNYGGLGLGGLLDTLVGVKKRIRLGSLEVNVITDEFLQTTTKLYDFAPHFHLSLQSASDNVLKSMNRHYTFKEYAEKVALIRKYYPNGAITTDIIAGFPTETEEDFICSLNSITEIGFADVHCFPYSPRNGTVAYKMKDLPMPLKKERTERLLQAALKGKLQFVKDNLNSIQTVVFEEFDGEYTAGYTANYVRTYLKGNHSGKLLKVKLTESYLEGAIAQLYMEE